MAPVEEIHSEEWNERKLDDTIVKHGGYMGYWTIMMIDNNRTREFSARYLTNSSSSVFVSFRFRTTVYARYR